MSAREDLGLAVLMEVGSANYSWPVAVVSTAAEAREVAAARAALNPGYEYRLYWQDERGEYSQLKDIEL